MNLQLHMLGFRAGLARRKYFNSDYMKKYFESEHKEAFGEELPMGGFPDCGNGKYSEKWSYK